MNQLLKIEKKTMVETKNIKLLIFHQAKHLEKES